MALDILPATSADIPELVEVLCEAANFKSAHGDYLWGDKPYTPDEVEGMITSGNMHTVRVDGSVAATVTLTRTDERMWGPERGSDGTAIYIHGLASSNRFRGQQVGKRIVDWTAQLASKEARQNLRLNCSYSLGKYYTSLGFQEIERVDVTRKATARDLRDPIYKAILFQKPI